MRAVRALAASGIALLLVVVLSGANFGSNTRGTYLLPSTDMSIRATGISGAWYTAFEWSALDYAFTTDLRPRLSRGSCSSRYHRYCVFQVNAGNSGWAGQYHCQRPNAGSHPNITCDHAYIRINTYYEDRVSRIALACHELGHGVGLRHRDGNTCMNRASHPGISTTLGDHDRAHINNRY